MRLVAFGDSCTYGVGLADCWDVNLNKWLDTPSKYSYPCILGDLLKRQTDNISFPGIGAKRVLWNIYRYTFTGSEIVVITWPNSIRKDIFQEKDYFTIRFGSAGNNNMNERLEAYIKFFYYEYNDCIDLVTYIKAANDYLSTKNIAAYNLFTTTDDYKNIALYDLASYIKNIDVIDVCINTLSSLYNDYGLDKQHPGNEAHKIYAEKIFKWINNE